MPLMLHRAGASYSPEGQWWSSTGLEEQFSLKADMLRSAVQLEQFIIDLLRSWLEEQFSHMADMLRSAV